MHEQILSPNAELPGTEASGQHVQSGTIVSGISDCPSRDER
ncbi:hypothetical protein [Tropheryma whipplei]|nr:hypothetical protein [Tropheryma whipplei]